jgi:hypothetical protein
LCTILEESFGQPVDAGAQGLQAVTPQPAPARRAQFEACDSAVCAIGKAFVPDRNLMKKTMSPVPGGMTKIASGTTVGTISAAAVTRHSAVQFAGDAE